MANVEVVEAIAKTDWTFVFAFMGIILTIIATGIGAVTLIYSILRNFKTDVNKHIDDLSKRMDQFELKITSLEERMFLLATGKTLREAIVEEQLKKKDKE
jgi:hypothetical protein